MVTVSDIFTVATFTSPGAELVLGPIRLRWYGLLIASAVLVGVSLAQKVANRKGLNPDIMSDLAIWLVIGAIPAARLYYVLFQWRYYRNNPGEIVAIWQGGIAIHGAILGGMLATFLFCRLKQLSFWRLADTVAPSLILGQAIGRWGNFFNSEAYGAPTNLPWKLSIPAASRPPSLGGTEFYHPTFLYESLWNLGVFGLLMLLTFRFTKLKTGSIFLVYAIAYSLGRIWIEGLRLDSLMLGPLRIAQVVSLTGITVGGVGLLWLYLFKRQLPDLVTPASRVSS
ncbi:MAG: prolipoprotein diacylglyceryl transferase [Cyanobacteria bacterium P01_F01_bin.42]